MNKKQVIKALKNAKNQYEIESIADNAGADMLDVCESDDAYTDNDLGGIPGLDYKRINKNIDATPYLNDLYFDLDGNYIKPNDLKPIAIEAINEVMPK